MKQRALNNPEILVLLSGGVDSAACLNFFLDLGKDVITMFVDYEQPARLEEKLAAEKISDYYNVPLLKTSWHGVKKKNLV